ncbi:MAG: permease prefix domain 2-containing transporter [Bacteroidia bacterium]|nr:permease prefix domain 2-containing transporter [Bacteroidia bacterium]
MEQFENTPPNWALALLRFIVHPEFQEEIEGDLLEKYESDLQKDGLKAAQRRFYTGLFSVVKPSLIFNLNHTTMKPRNGLVLVFIILVVMTASVAPFLPGFTNNRFSHGISQFAQNIGYIGMAFIPFGLIWLIIEIRNKKGQKLNRWTNGYYPSWLVIAPILLFLPLKISLTIIGDQPFDLLPFAIIISVVAFFIYRIQKLKGKKDYKFNPAPLYIVLIPVIALLTSKFALERAAVFSREKAILKTEPLIAAIEKYKTERGEYPEKLEELEGEYIPEIPRINPQNTIPYHYEKGKGSFQLSFEQLWHWNATEVVVYNTSGQKGIKGNYENHPTEHTNWWYYFAD